MLMNAVPAVGSLKTIVRRSLWSACCAIALAACGGQPEGEPLQAGEDALRISYYLQVNETELHAGDTVSFSYARSNLNDGAIVWCRRTEPTGTSFFDTDYFFIRFPHFDNQGNLGSVELNFEGEAWCHARLYIRQWGSNKDGSPEAAMVDFHVLP
jgi:hypothetical protein